MPSKNSGSGRARKTGIPPKAILHPPAAHEPKNVPDAPDEDLLLLMAQRTEKRRHPNSFLDGWIRRFVRG